MKSDITQLDLSLRQAISEAKSDKSLDWRAMAARRKGKVSGNEIAEIRAKAHALVGK